MRKSLVTVFLVFLFSFAGINLGLDMQTDVQQKSLVVDVVDGDTVDIRRNERSETVRVLGVDTPEKYGAVTPSEFYLENTTVNRRCLENMAQKASKLVEDRVSDQKIKLVQDSLSDKRGSYGRLLGYIEHNQTDIGKTLLEKGYARVYNSSFERKEQYRALETESRENNEGIWNESCGA